MSHHLRKIFEPWSGNAEAMAADIGESGVNVRQWRNRGSIHSDHWPKIIRAAAARGFEILPEDFWPPEVQSDLPSHIREHAPPEQALSATKIEENIRDGEGGHGPPFSPISSSTSSPPAASGAAPGSGSRSQASSPSPSPIPSEERPAA